MTLDDTTRVHMKVPLHYSGEENSPAVNTDHCLVSHVANEVEIVVSDGNGGEASQSFVLSLVEQDQSPASPAVDR